MWFSSGVVEAVVEFVPQWFALVLLVFSYVGSVYIIGPATIVGYLFGDRRHTVAWPGIIIGAYALFVFLKPLFGIPRPGVEPPVTAAMVPTVLAPIVELAVDFDTGSFPSGHAIAATVFYGLLVVDLRVSTFRRRLLFAAGVICMIGFTRVALGVHYPGDVVGGLVIGITFLAGMLFVRERVANPGRAMLLLAAIPALVSGMIGEVTRSIVLLSAILIMLFVIEVGDERSNSVVSKVILCKVRKDEQ